MTDTNKISIEIARDVLKALGGPEFARAALERGELNDVESESLMQVLESHEVDLAGDLKNMFVVIKDALEATQEKKTGERRQSINLSRKEARAAKRKALEELAATIPEDKRAAIVKMLNKEIGTPPPQRLFIFGLMAGAVVFGYVMKWTPVGETAYLMTQGQLATWAISLFLAGAILPIAVGFPMLKYKKWKTEKMGKQAIIIEYQFRNGQKTIDIKPYSEQIELNKGRHVLVNPSFTFMGLPGYKICEGVLCSLDFDFKDVEVQVNDLAASLEDETTYKDNPEDDKSKTFTLVPRGDVIAAMHPANLLHYYNYGLDLGLDAGSTAAEHRLKLIVILAGGAMIASIVSAYLTYDLSATVPGLSNKLGELLAYVQAQAGINQP